MESSEKVSTRSIRHDMRVAADAPLGPVGRLEVEVEPTKKNLIGRQAQELLERLVVLEQTIQLGVVLNVNLIEQTLANDLPDEAEDEVLAAFNEVRGADVDD